MQTTLLGLSAGLYISPLNVAQVVLAAKELGEDVYKLEDVEVLQKVGHQGRAPQKGSQSGLLQRSERPFLLATFEKGIRVENGTRQKGPGKSF